MRWDLPKEQVFDALIIPSAYTNLTCMNEGARVTGVTTGRYEYKVKGKGVIFGVMFKPGGIYPFYKDQVKSLTDQFVPASDIFKQIDSSYNDKVISIDDTAGIELFESTLLSADPQEDANIALVNEIIDYAKSNRQSSIKSIARQFTMSERKMQGLFEKYVGVGLKWIMLRDRLQEATLIAESSGKPNWIIVAADLGYSDQSHFNNDFKRIIGVSPLQYSR